MRFMPPMQRPTRCPGKPDVGLAQHHMLQLWEEGHLSRYFPDKLRATGQVNLLTSSDHVGGYLEHPEGYYGDPKNSEGYLNAIGHLTCYNCGRTDQFKPNYLYPLRNPMFSTKATNNKATERMEEGDRKETEVMDEEKVRRMVTQAVYQQAEATNRSLSETFGWTAAPMDAHQLVDVAPEQ